MDGFRVHPEAASVPFGCERRGVRQIRFDSFRDGRSCFPLFFFILVFEPDFLRLALRFAQGGEEETFALGLVREKAVDRMVIF